MPNHIRTARPSGDIRGFEVDCDRSGGWESGKLVKIQDTVGIIFEDADFGDAATVHYHIEKVMVEKCTATGSAFAVGDKVFWDGNYGTNVANACVTGYYWIGVCVRAAADSATEVMIDLKGDKATLCPHA